MIEKKNFQVVSSEAEKVVGGVVEGNRDCEKILFCKWFGNLLKFLRCSIIENSIHRNVSKIIKNFESTQRRKKLQDFRLFPNIYS